MLVGNSVTFKLKKNAQELIKDFFVILGKSQNNGASHQMRFI